MISGLVLAGVVCVWLVCLWAANRRADERLNVPHGRG